MWLAVVAAGCLSAPGRKTLEDVDVGRDDAGEVPVEAVEPPVDLGVEADSKPEPQADVTEEGGDGWVADVGEGPSGAVGTVRWPAVFAGVSKGGGLTLTPFAPAGAWNGESVGGGLKVRSLVP